MGKVKALNLTPAFLVIMAGQGDIHVKLVDQEIWDWFKSAPPDFKDDYFNEIGLVSPRIKAAFEAEWAADVDEEEEHEIGVTSGSWENDRMLLCPASLCLYEEYGTEYAVRTAKSWAKKHGYKIVETEEDGCIY